MTRKEKLVAEAEEAGLETADMTIPQLEEALAKAEAEDSGAEVKTDPPPAPVAKVDPQKAADARKALTLSSTPKPTSPSTTGQPEATEAAQGEKLYAVNWTIRLPAGYNHKGDTVSLDEKTAASLEGAVTAK